METGWITPVGWTGVAVAVVGWLIVSLSTPSARRVVFEWVAACGIYVALLALFSNLALRAHQNGNTAVLVLFGFLVTFFGSGLVVCVVHTLLSLRSPAATSTSTTN